MMIKPKLLIQTLMGMGLTLGAIAVSARPGNTQDRFFCDENLVSTIVNTERGAITMIKWSDRSFAPPWTPVERCKEVSRRFQRFYDHGILRYVRTGEVNNQPVLCATQSQGESCIPESILVTFKPGTDPQLVLERLLDKRAWSSAGPIELSAGNGNNRSSGIVNLSGGDEDKEYISQVDGETYLDIESFLSEQ